MNTTYHIKNARIVAGTTWKNQLKPEQNNMALHACNDPHAIIQNRIDLATELHCKLSDFVCAQQTHSTHYYRVTAADKGRGADRLDTAIADTDALYTYEPNIVLCTFTADCVPIFFWNEKTDLIGVIHSGWQGTVKEMTSKLFQHLMHDENCDPTDIKIHIGPALSQQKFEVDYDVCSQFQALGYAKPFITYNEQTCKFHIDNQQTVKAQGERMGIPSENISLDPTCTYQHPAGFSYREDKKSGRHLHFIMRNSD